MNHDEIKKIIQDIFTHSGCTMTSCTFSLDQDHLWCVIETPDSRLLIGRDGETLQSLNHIVRRIIDTKNNQERSNLHIDINGHQKKHFDDLKTQAHILSERARYFKSSIESDPMNSSDRRVIHMFLENAPNIKTESTGSGSDRRVVIKYIEDTL